MAISFLQNICPSCLHITNASPLVSCSSHAYWRQNVAAAAFKIFSQRLWHDGGRCSTQHQTKVSWVWHGVEPRRLDGQSSRSVITSRYSCARSSTDMSLSESRSEHSLDAATSDANASCDSRCHALQSRGHRDHVTPALQQLHWLPIQARVQFKLCTLMYGIHNRQCPAYSACFSDAVQSVAITSTREGLRSDETINYICNSRLRSKFGERAFSHAGPAAWNQLSVTIRNAQTQAHFKKLFCIYTILQLLLNLLTVTSFKCNVCCPICKWTLNRYDDDDDDNCHQWLSHSFRVHQIRFRPGLRPRIPLGELTALPQTPQLV